MFGYLAVGFGGFMIGVILSCILLAKKNLETAQRMGNNAVNVVDSFKQNLDTAKSVYKATIDEYESEDGKR